MSALTDQGLQITLGGQIYFVRPLPIGKDLEWRRRVGKLVAEITRGMDREKPQEFMAVVLNHIAGEGMDELVQTMWMLEWEPPLPPAPSPTGKGEDGPDGAGPSRVEMTRAVVEVFRAYYVPFVESLKDLMLLLV